MIWLVLLKVNQRKSTKAIKTYMDFGFFFSSSALVHLLHLHYGGVAKGSMLPSMQDVDKKNKKQGGGRYKTLKMYSKICT